MVDDKGRDVKPNGKEIEENVVMKGYWKEPEEEGYIPIADRKKDIISSGEIIASLEIERVLYSHPAILEATVIAIPDDFWGEVPKALVVLKAGESATAEEIIKHCRGKIAGFKLPKSADFVTELPEGGTGKILKNVLSEKYWAGYQRRVH